MRIAVDVCIGTRGVALLRESGHEVIEAEHGERDREWFARAIRAGVELFVSADADIEIYAYDEGVTFFQARQGESGIATIRRLLEQIHSLTR